MVLYEIIIAPIEAIIEFIFCFVYVNLSELGVAGAIVAVSLAVNLLTLPIYNVADSIQIRERELQKKMGHWVTHIKKTFKGDEQFMILSEYYRQNEYHPLYALRQSLSVLIQIPFFIAAYHFLSNCPLLENQSVLFLKDLSKPDAVIQIGDDFLCGWRGYGYGMCINILPVLMTLLNVASSAIYTKGAPPREKIQTFALALVFLVLLYNSPSGLVFYWVLNQVFSLCKNIVKKYFHPKPWRVIHALLVFIFLVPCIYPIFVGKFDFAMHTYVSFGWVLIFALFPCFYKFKVQIATFFFKRLVPVFVSCLLLLVCLWLYFFRTDPYSKNKVLFYALTLFFIAATVVKKALKQKKYLKKINLSNFMLSDNQNFALFFVSCISLCLLCGLLLPSSVIASSPAEFSFLGSMDSPLSYVWESLIFFVGLFVFWPLVVYKMFSENKMVKLVMPPLFFLFAMCALANAFLFKYDYGTMNFYFKLDNSDILDNSDMIIENYSVFFIILPVLFLIFVSIVYLFFHRFKIAKILPFFVFVSIFAEAFVGAVKVKSIKIDFPEIARIHNENTKRMKKNTLDVLPVNFHLSKTEKNVIILFLDRGISAYFPYILEQFPDMKNSFDGIVYYPNCISFGGNTVNAASPLIGGYDYIPQEIRKDSRLLVEKHNEALLVLPQNFHEAGYSVTIADLPYADYKWDMDLKFYEQYDYIDANARNALYGEKYVYEHRENLEPTDASMITKKNIKEFSVLQILYPPLRKTFYGDGQYYTSLKYFDEPEFVNSYAELYYLTNMTDFDSQQSSFIFFENGTSHASLELAAPDYRPALVGKGDFSIGTGNYDYVYETEDYLSYQTNAAALIQIARWFDYLKENDVYDNTRIIIVSDHGYRHMNRKFVDFKTYKKVTNFNPLFLFKDFDSHGEPETDNTFISNAETPYFATKNLDVADINPFTKNKFRQASDFDVLEIVKVSEDDISPNSWLDKTEFRNKGTEHYTVHDNIFDESNWKKLDSSEAKK